jgi:hypothetical protein
MERRRGVWYIGAAIKRQQRSMDVLQTFTHSGMGSIIGDGEALGMEDLDSGDVD